MRVRGNLLLLILALISLSSWQRPGGVDEWVYEREKQGIKIFTKKSKWGHLRDSKAVMTVSDSPDEMLRLLTDFDKYPTWLPRCKKARVVARLSPNEFIAQIVFAVPWPFKDRDCVLRVRVDENPQTGVILVTETSEPKYIKEQEGVVRIQQLTATWKLVPKNGGTEVTNEYASNPGSDIPDWLTNTQSVETPMTTFENILIKTTTRK
jgi:ribosome-associated toxin RatA of RatAB toxin-antitoxin module